MIATKDSTQNQTHLPCAVIMTALQEECQTVTAHLSDLEEDEDRHRNVYDCGIFSGPGQSWKVAVAEIGAGNLRAAVKVHNALDHFNPDVLLFVGVAGSLKQDIPLGSVVASTKIYDYQPGKAGEIFQTRPEIAYPDGGLEQRARATARRDNWIRRILNPQFPAQTPPKAFQS
jgi:nucleoside phosphorylase